MMKRFFLLTVVSIITLNNLQAQALIKRKDEGEHRLSLSFTPQQYFNGINISGEGQPQVMHTQNTFGYKFGLDYQRTTRYGLIFGGGIYYGSQRNTVDVVYGDNMSWFDPNAEHPEQLVNLEPTKLTYAFTSKYMALQLIAGYSFKLPTNWGKGLRLETRLGVTSRYYLNSAPKENMPPIDWRIGYEKHDTLFITSFGQDNGGFSYKGEIALAETFDLYLGINKSVNIGWINSFSLGFEIGKSFFLDRGGSASIYNNTKNFYGQVISHSYYKAQNLSLGIKAAIGLWPPGKSKHR